MVELAAALRSRGGGLIVLHATARTAIPELAAALGVDAVYANRDYEPAARDRDAAVATALAGRGIVFRTVKDQVIFEGGEIVSAGKPFCVFTPYRNAWLKALTPAHFAPSAQLVAAGTLAPPPRDTDDVVPSLEAWALARRTSGR